MDSLLCRRLRNQTREALGKVLGFSPGTAASASRQSYDAEMAERMNLAGTAVVLYGFARPRLR